MSETEEAVAFYKKYKEFIRKIQEAEFDSFGDIFYYFSNIKD